MGTNFYWQNAEAIGIPEDTVVQHHIGKRSAAGWYCWDCLVPLVEGGNKNVHSSTARRLDTCPVCSKGKQSHDALSEGAAAIELGFAKPNTDRSTGVRTCSSFSWAQDPEMVGSFCNRYRDEQIIEDEYGRPMTGREFSEMIASNCPVQFTNSIGRDFS